MERRELFYEKADLRYEGIIGTGGIGTGIFFRLNGNHTLGREESRSGYFLDVKDYCKQHIILHYVKVLLGDFPVIPVGRVGDDTYGNVLMDEMRDTGFVMDYVEKLSDISTLFSFCFSYDDGSGGNLTTDNSASSLVDIDVIHTVEREIEKLGTKGIMMAAPEVPFETRKYFIEFGKQKGLFCTASFTTEEIPLAIESGVLAGIDLLAVNIDEAAAVTGSLWEDEYDIVPLIEQTVQKLLQYNEHMLISVTAGKKGSWCWTGQNLNHFPAIETTVESTAGAGDSFFSGLLCGKVLGLNMVESQQLATLIAGHSVQSPHTINKETDRCSLKKFMESSGLSFSKTIINLLKD